MTEAIPSAAKASCSPAYNIKTNVINRKKNEHNTITKLLYNRCSETKGLTIYADIKVKLSH